MPESTKTFKLPDNLEVIVSGTPVPLVLGICALTAAQQQAVEAALNTPLSPVRMHDGDVTGESGDSEESEEPRIFLHRVGAARFAVDTFVQLRHHQLEASRAPDEANHWQSNGQLRWRPTETSLYDTSLQFLRDFIAGGPEAPSQPVTSLDELGDEFSDDDADD